MKLENQSYYYLPKKFRLIYGFLLILILLIPLLDNFAGFLFFSIWSIICLFGSLCLFFSKLYITNESVRLTWSPFITSMNWCDAVGIKIGHQNNIPGNILYVRLKNYKLVHFPIHQLSEYNFNQICKHFGLNLNQSGSLQSDGFEPVSILSEPPAIVLLGDKYNLKLFFEFIFVSFLIVGGVLIFFLPSEEEFELAILCSLKYLGLPVLVISLIFFFKYPALLSKTKITKSRLIFIAFSIAVIIVLNSAMFLSIGNHFLGPHRIITIDSPIINKYQSGKYNQRYIFKLEEKTSFYLNYELSVSKETYAKYKEGELYSTEFHIGNFGIPYR